MKKSCVSEKRRGPITLGCVYLKHLVKGKTTHGIHSPFLFNFLKDCVYAKVSFKEFEDIEKQRYRLKKDNRVIEVCDFGSYKSESESFVERKQKISSIAKTSFKSPRQAMLLYKIAGYFKCHNILELGTSLGITSAYMSKACPGSVLNTIEGCPQVAKTAQGVFDALAIDNIRLHIGDIDKLLVPVLKETGAPDMIFIDANHTKQATLYYFDVLLNHIYKNTVIVIDDIHWSKGMEDAWNKICEHPDVSVTVDLFYMGIIFFREGLSKEDFLIKC